MKKKVAALLAAVMAVTSFSALSMAASANTLSKANTVIEHNKILISGVDNKDISLLDSQEGIDSIASGIAVSLQIKPTSEVRYGESILLTVENGKFDERLVNAAPFIFRTEKTGTTYDEIIEDDRDINTVLKTYVGNENSRKLPYGFRYIDDNMIEVKLYPIGDDKVNTSNSDVTKGTPYYDIALPITTEGSSNGFVSVYIDSNDSTISSSSHNVAKVASDVNIPIVVKKGSVNSISVNDFRIKKDEVLIMGVDNNDVNVLDTQKGIDSLKNGTPVALQIKPTKEVEKGTTIKLNIKNGKFDKRLVNADPFVYKTELTEISYDTINRYVEDGGSINNALTLYVGNENSRKLPYDLKYVNDKQIEVTLFPIGDDKVNFNNNDVTQGTPYYNIALPVTTEGSNYGDVIVSIEFDNTIIVPGNYIAATVSDEDDEIKVSPSTDTSNNTISINSCRVDKDNVVIIGADDRNISVLDSDAGIESLKNATPVSLRIIPKVEVKKGSSIILIAENGKFDERLINADPYIFRSELTGVSFDIINNYVLCGVSPNNALEMYVGCENSRRLPYDLKYISPEMIEVTLFPIDDNKVNRNNTDVTKGTPYYDIALPLTTVGSVDGPVKVGIYANNTAISGGSYTAAVVGNGEYDTIGGSSVNTLSYSNNSIKNKHILIRGLDDEKTDISVLDTQAGIDSLVFGTPVSLDIRPLYEIKAGTTIKLNIENGSFDQRLINADKFVFKTNHTGIGYDEIMNDNRDINTVLTTYIGNENSRKLPYGIKYINDKQLEISLYPIGDDKVNQNNSDVTKGSPYYSIALPVVAKDCAVGDDIMVSVDGTNTAISNGKYKIATIIPDGGITIAYVVAADVKTTTDTIYTIPDITIKEEYAGTFNDQTVRIVLGGKNKWIKEGQVVAGINCWNSNLAKDININGNILEFTLTGKNSFNKINNSSIIIKGFEIEANSLGDVHIIISGDEGITSQTIKVGTIIRKTEEISESVTATESKTETTTARYISSSSGGGGGGSSYKATTTTTMTTTEATTEATTAVIEDKTETTTYALPEVRVVIGSNDILVDNKTYSMDVAPYIQPESNSTLVPLRFVSIALSGGDVDNADTSNLILWDSESKQATINKNNISIVFTAGSNKVVVNGKEVAMDYGVAAEIKDNRMFVPFRFIGEALGYAVDWEASSKTAIYKAK